MTRTQLMKKRNNDKRVQTALEAYNSNIITSTEGLVNFFSLMLKSGRIKTLPVGHKRIAEEFIRDGFLDEKGNIL